MPPNTSLAKPSSSMGNGGQQSALPLMPKLAPQITLAPPPWTLRGEGIMLLYRFKKLGWKASLISQPSSKVILKEALAMSCLWTTSSSPIGPYKELIFIPGQFGKKKFQSITRILVSSEASTNHSRKIGASPRSQLASVGKKKKERTTFR